MRNKTTAKAIIPGELEARCVDWLAAQRRAAGVAGNTARWSEEVQVVERKVRERRRNEKEDIPDIPDLD